MNDTSQDSFSQYDTSPQNFTDFFREFSHTLRTPLSVILHELEYVKQTGDSANVDKALTKSQSIIQLLKEFSDIFSMQDLSLADFVRWIPSGAEVSHEGDMNKELRYSIAQLASPLDTDRNVESLSLQDLVGVVSDFSLLRALALDVVREREAIQIRILPEGEGIVLHLSREERS